MRVLAWCCLLLSTSLSFAQTLADAERSDVDAAAREVLQSTGAPSASIAIVRGGKIIYEQAYGDARLDPKTPATPSMRYAIGSVSKQFTAAAILLLAEEGKLSLDDRIAKWFPELTRAKDISVRQLLSMTSGYQDYWPHDYVFHDMQAPIAPKALIARWARKLDFEPGTRWQYSNTNYVMAGLIVERVAGMPLIDFLRQRIFVPLKMTSVADFNTGPLGNADAAPFLRHALGPPRLAPKEASGWLFGAGQLGMTAHDLALWNISVIDRTVLRPESYRAQQTSAVLEQGNATGYGLGVGVSPARDQRRSISHGGAVSGYTTQNRIYPDDRMAIVVFTNIYPGAADAPSQIADRIAEVIFAGDGKPDTDALQLARKIYDGLAKGSLDRTQLTGPASEYFSTEALSDYAASLGPLGAPTEFVQTGQSVRGGLNIRDYRIVAGKAVMSLVTMTLPDGRLDQYIISREE